MRHTPNPSAPPERVADAARYTVLHPWEIFVAHWNWKAALLSALFRGVAFGVAMARLTRRRPWRSVLIEMIFRAAVGGSWGSVIQRFRKAEPAWLAGALVSVPLALASHALEYAVLRAGGATGVRTGMVVSVVISAGSLLLNLRLIRRGVLITGEGSESLLCDLRRIPGALVQNGPWNLRFESCGRKEPLPWKS
jgi:hypothetical protein